MPTNKNALIRYQILDRCFSDFRHKHTIDDLIDRVNDTLLDLYGTKVSLRQIREDIKYMRDRMTYNAPITAYPLEGRKCYYRYEDPDFSIFKNELTVEEVDKLRSTIEMLGRYRGLPNHRWLEEVISSLECRLGIRTNRENLIAFEQNERLKGLEFLAEVIDATLRHQPLTLDYKPYSGEEQVCTLHPYYVKQYNNRWFLFGLEEESGRIANKALDRILRICSSESAFQPNKGIDFEHFFDDIVGVSVPDAEVSKEHVVLRFTPNRYPYVLSKPIHPSQAIADEAAHTLSLNVKPTRELDQQLLSFGPDVEVVAPASYRQHIRKKLEEALKKYATMQDDCTNNC